MLRIVIKCLQQRFIAPIYYRMFDVYQHRKASRTNQGSSKQADCRTEVSGNSCESPRGRKKSKSYGRGTLYFIQGFLQSRGKDSQSKQEIKVSRKELTLLFFLGFFISYTVFYYLDGGLLASNYCLVHGETEECFRLMELAK